MEEGTLRIIGIVHVYNEADVIEQFLEHMRKQSIQLIVLDNGSTDETYQIISKDRSGIVLRHAQLITEKFELIILLRCLHSMAVMERPDWILHVDADEFMEDRLGMPLREAIIRESLRGFNLIQFDNYEFWPTPKDPSVPEITKQLKYYSWNDRWQFRAWRHGQGIRIHPSGGHLPIFPKKMRVNLSPTRFVLRHYSVRGYEQGRRKVFQERLGRYAKFDMDLFKMSKYQNYRDEPTYFVIDHEKLTRCDEDGNWNNERKFPGWRIGNFPDLHTSREVQKAMDEIARQYDEFCID